MPGVLRMLRTVSWLPCRIARCAADLSADMYIHMTRGAVGSGIRLRIVLDTRPGCMQGYVSLNRIVCAMSMLGMKQRISSHGRTFS